MFAFQRVLFPIDLSLDYQTLSAAARKMFDRPGVEIVLLHVIEEPRSMRGMDVARAMAQMEFLARREFGFARSSRRVERGRPAEAILACARNMSADVIVIPAGGEESARRGALGHLTEEVLTGAPSAVWLDRATDSLESGRQICCAISLDGTDKAVLSYADEVAREFGAELTILHALVPESPMLLWLDADAIEQEIRMARMRADELREKYAPAAHLHIAAGRPERVIGQALQRLDAGLLVAAGHGEVMATAACPVLRIAAGQPELSPTVQMERGKAVAAAGAA